MAIQAMNAVWKLESLSVTQKMVLLALADSANNEGVCWPSVRLLVRKTALGERVIRETIGGLTRRRLLDTGRRLAENGRPLPNVYTVLVGREEVEGGVGARGSPIGARGSPIGARGSPIGARGEEVSKSLTLPLHSSLLPNLKKNHQVNQGDKTPGKPSFPGHTPSRKREVRITDQAMKAEFETFWRRYPYKQKRPEAERAFLKAWEQGGVAPIMAGLERAIQSAEWARVDREGLHFIPHPATWLNQRGWESEYHPKIDKGDWKKEFLAGGK